MGGIKMEKITIKPHHFMDIIKLYGTGIERFVPDQKRGHDFYRIANLIVQNPTLLCQLTVEGDDICKPCLYYRHYQCQDFLVHTSKQRYNQLLDQRIIQLYQLYDMSYSTLSLCEILLEHHEMIEQVWKEEPAELTQKRHDFFVKGAELYIHQYGIIKSSVNP